MQLTIFPFMFRSREIYDSHKKVAVLEIDSEKSGLVSH